MAAVGFFDRLIAFWLWLVDPHLVIVWTAAMFLARRIVSVLLTVFLPRPRLFAYRLCLFDMRLRLFGRSLRQRRLRLGVVLARLPVSAAAIAAAA